MSELGADAVAGFPADCENTRLEWLDRPGGGVKLPGGWNLSGKASKETGRSGGELGVRGHVLMKISRLVMEQRTHHQITGEPMKFLTVADWMSKVETDVFAQTYRSCGMAEIRCPVSETWARLNHSRMCGEAKVFRVRLFP